MATKLRFAHIGVHNMANDNAGDTLLFQVVRWLFEFELGDIDWDLIPVWQPLSVLDIERINEDFDAIVLGGGGLFLADQQGAPVTPGGWQWNVTIEALQAISIPLIVFAVGYNRFRGQGDFSESFAPHVETLLRKSSFFGLRNQGSIRAIQHYVPDSLWDSIRLQPCPTTVMRNIPPVRALLPYRRDHAIAFNAAYDRPQYRLGGDWGPGLSRLVSAMEYAAKNGWRVDAVAHKVLDEQFFDALASASVDFQAVSLSGKGPEAVISYYASVAAAVGMRGHAQMIPLGVGVPIFSAVTHDKMRFLLEDIGHPEWGHELGHEGFFNRFKNYLSELNSNPGTLNELTSEASDRLWEMTRSNMRLIARSLAGRV